MNQLLPTFEYVPITPESDVELAHAIAVELDRVITPAQTEIDTIQASTQRQSNHVMRFAALEHLERHKKGEDNTFVNLEKLIPILPPVTNEEYENFGIEIRQKILTEANMNKYFLANLSGLIGGVALRQLSIESSHRIIMMCNKYYNHLYQAHMQSPTYQGARHDPPYSQSDEFRKLHYAYHQATSGQI